MELAHHREVTNSISMHVVVTDSQKKASAAAAAAAGGASSLTPHRSLDLEIAVRVMGRCWLHSRQK